jgi:hypothetical protein
MLLGFFLPPLCLVVIQRHANRMNAASAPAHDRNDQFSAWNWAVLVPGALLLLALSFVVVFQIE